MAFFGGDHNYNTEVNDHEESQISTAYGSNQRQILNFHSQHSSSQHQQTTTSFPASTTTMNEVDDDEESHIFAAHNQFNSNWQQLVHSPTFPQQQQATT